MEKQSRSRICKAKTTPTEARPSRLIRVYKGGSSRLPGRASERTSQGYP